jgi:hypothetical protein
MIHAGRGQYETEKVIRSGAWSRQFTGDLERQTLLVAVVEAFWEPNIRALAFVPSVLLYMHDNLDGTQDPGETF